MEEGQQLVDSKDLSVLEFKIPKPKVSYKSVEPTATVTSGDIDSYSDKNVATHTQEPVVPDAAIPEEHTHRVTGMESTSQGPVVTSARVSLSEQVADETNESIVHTAVAHPSGQSMVTATTGGEKLAGYEAIETDNTHEVAYDINEIIKRCYSVSKKLDDERVRAIGEKV